MIGDLPKQRERLQPWLAQGLGKFEQLFGLLVSYNASKRRIAPRHRRGVPITNRMPLCGGLLRFRTCDK